MFAWLGYLLNAKRVLRGRAADFALCRLPGVDDRITEQALNLICDAFIVPSKQRYCLRPEDELLRLYLDGTKRPWIPVGDNLEFEHLFLGLDELGVCLSEEEIERIATVGDMIRVLAEHSKN